MGKIHYYEFWHAIQSLCFVRGIRTKLWCVFLLRVWIFFRNTGEKTLLQCSFNPLIRNIVSERWGLYFLPQLLIFKNTTLTLSNSALAREVKREQSKSNTFSTIARSPAAITFLTIVAAFSATEYAEATTRMSRAGEAILNAEKKQKANLYVSFFKRRQGKYIT